MLKKFTIAISLTFSLAAALSRPGDRLMSIELKNVNEETCWLPGETTLPVVVFYDEYGEMDANSAFENMILPLAKQKKIRICRVINMAPSWFISDLFIFNDMKRTVSQSEFMEYYFDKDELLMVKWRLKPAYAGKAILIIDSNGILVQDIYGTMEWNEAVSFAKFLESVR